MVELEELTKKYPDATLAVDRVSFKVATGEVFGLLGRSGCGKTTTLKMINRLIEPTSGHICVNGQSVFESVPEKLRRNIGYVIQGVGLFPHYTIEENVAVVPRLLGWNEARIRDRSHELLQMVGLDPDDFAARTPDALSGGQQQRVGVARALAGDPDLLLMDEPFGALDPITKEEVRSEFKKLLSEIGKTVILVTHDIFEAFDLCSRICLLDQGRVQQVGTPSELLFNPENTFVSSFFDGHRFQLEMSNLSIGDILQKLPLERGELPEAHHKLKSVGIEATILSVFDLIKGKERVVLKDRQGQIIGTVGSSELLEGFQWFRSGPRGQS